MTLFTSFRCTDLSRLGIDTLVSSTFICSHHVSVPVFTETFGLSLCFSCSLSRLFPRRSSGISRFILCVRCLVVCCAPSGTTLFLHTEWLSRMDGFSIASPKRSPNSKVSGGGFTSHVVDVAPSAWPICCSFTGARRVHRALHLYFVSLVVFFFIGVLLIKRIESRPWTLPHPYQGPGFEHDQRVSDETDGDILPNALVPSVDPNVVVKKRMRNLIVESIVCGSGGILATSCGRRDRTFCRSNLPNGLHRFQKLDVPLFTPATETDDMAELLREDMAARAKHAALGFFERDSEIMRARGLILIDTKCAFGFDRDGVLRVIDEVNTPDSSRQ